VFRPDCWFDFGRSRRRAKNSQNSPPKINSSSKMAHDSENRSPAAMLIAVITLAMGFSFTPPTAAYGC
jgi:hypothetical protein